MEKNRERWRRNSLLLLFLVSLFLWSCLPEQESSDGEEISSEELVEISSEKALAGMAGQQGRTPASRQRLQAIPNTRNCRTDQQGQVRAQIRRGIRWQWTPALSTLCDNQRAVVSYTCLRDERKKTSILAQKTLPCPSGQYCPRGEKICKSLCGNRQLDAGEQCDSGDCCTTQCTFAPSGKECRAADGQCDTPEVCDGASAICPEFSKKECATSEENAAPSEVKNIKTSGYTALIDASDGLVGSLSRDKVISLIDITTLGFPKIFQTLDTPGFAEVSYDDGKHLFIGDSKELRILSSNTPSGEPIGTYTLNDFWPSAMTIDKNYAYIVSGSKMLILNIEDLSKPSEISRVSLTGDAPTEVHIQGEYAYVVETLGGLNIVDIKNPAEPKVVKVFPFQSHTAGFEIQGDYAYLGSIKSVVSAPSTSTGYTTTSLFEVIDISHPASASVVSSQEIATDIRGLDISETEKKAYVIGSYPHRLTAIDISSPTNPKILPTPESIVGNADLQDIVVSGGYAFIADGTAGLRIVDLRNPDQPIHVKDIDLEGRAFAIHQSKDKLHVHVEQQYFNVVDARNQNEPKLAFSERYTSAYPTASIVIRDKKAYLKSNEFKIYDLSDPSHPKQLNTISAEVDSIQVQGKYLYSTIGEIGLLVYDISDFANPRKVATVSFPKGIPRDLSVDGSWAVGISNVPYSINIIDISNPEKPVPKESYIFEKYPSTVAVKENYVYVARGKDGVDIFKIKEGVPELIKNMGGKGYTQSVAVRENKAFVVREGIEIFDVTDHHNPLLADKIKVEGEALRIAVDGEQIYVANGFSGVGIIPYRTSSTQTTSSDTSLPQTSFRQSPEIPSDAERATLPECAEKHFSVFPVDLSKVYEIAPLGSVNPPGHTFPTEHTYLHFQAGGTSTTTYPLSAPAGVYITSISRGIGFTDDKEDYTIYFALCRDIIGYYNHVKELSPELKKIFDDANTAGKCKQNPGDTSYAYCQNSLNLIKEGSLMGEVGRLQGNFDFGLIDLKKTLNYVNPSRYGKRSLHIQCPYDYYPATMREKFFEKILRNDAQQCGTVAQDVAGTLQGNWFYATARADAGTDWTQYLALVHDNFKPEQQVISIGGVFTTAGKWYFTPQLSGEVNRRFSDVTNNGKIYCYYGKDQQENAQPGRILVQLTSATELQIEQQSGSCFSGNFAFGDAKKYQR